MTFFKQHLAKIQNLQDIDSPIVRWGSLLTVFIILWTVLFAPYLQWRGEQHQQLKQKIRKVSRLQALQAAEKKWQKAEQQYQQAETDMLDSLFQQSSYVTAQTELLNLLRQAIKKYNLTLQSQHLEESEQEPNIGQRISITLKLTGELISILRFTDNLSHHAKLLTIEKFYINKGTQQKLAVTLKVNGFRLANNANDNDNKD